jgi:hypothetical protein
MILPFRHIRRSVYKYIVFYICQASRQVRKQDDDHAVYREHALYIEKAVYITIIERIRSYHIIPWPYLPIYGENQADRPILAQNHHI